ncbi:MAG: 6-phosphofructokinase [Trueperaceae bacterium]|nr:6-phosphofructokinase [Trueperaceae bacterium]
MTSTPQQRSSTTLSTSETDAASRAETEAGLEPSPSPPPSNVAVLTSGGDAPGMNAAVRAVVRSALAHGTEAYAIFEGYQGLVDGGAAIRAMDWDAVGGILHRGGTMIGTARCLAFRSYEGRLKAAANLLERGIDRLVVIGGDGSLTGANLFRQEWPQLVADLRDNGTISEEVAARHPQLLVVGLVGSIDNDMVGTDMTIGADTALHRITEAIDALSSTAASHQRTFVVEVMGRHCGYLALMSALATGADWVFIPESPPTSDRWEADMLSSLKAARDAGRRESIVVVAEGAHDKDGQPITSQAIKTLLETELQQDTRVTILGHVQRGGSPSAFDRYMSTVLGFAATETLLAARPESESLLIGMRENRVDQTPLMQCVDQTHGVADTIKRGDYPQAVALRGGSFSEALQTFHTLSQARPRPRQDQQRSLRITVMNAGAAAPGMNTAARTAIRLGLDQGHTMLAVRNGFRGFIQGAIEEIGWMDVEDWAGMGGAELGTNRKVPEGGEFYALARNIESRGIDAVLIIGGWDAYDAAYQMLRQREQYPAFKLPTICVPASIANNLPGSEMSIGADTALNSIVDVVDKIKQSAVASKRTFVVEVLGRYCGYLALMSGLATGAERVYLHEEGVRLDDLRDDIDALRRGFEQGKRLGLVIRGEYANPIYSSDFIASLFQQESGGLFEVREAILGHLQQGGAPSPFDRIQATRLATRSVNFLVDKALAGNDDAAFIGLQRGKVAVHALEEFPKLSDLKFKRPREQWWLELRAIARIMAQPNAALALEKTTGHPPQA